MKVVFHTVWWKCSNKQKILEELYSVCPYTTNSILTLTIYHVFFFTSIHLSSIHPLFHLFFFFQNKLQTAVHFIYKYFIIHIINWSSIFVYWKFIFYTRVIDLIHLFCQKAETQEGLTQFMADSYWVIDENKELFENFLILKSCGHMEQPYSTTKRSLRQWQELTWQNYMLPSKC